jgi:hypothetical protein
MEERRRTVRERTYLGGVVAFNRQASTMDCLVRNLSPRGAKLALDGTGILPDSFDLNIERKERSYRARLVWRRFNDVGVAFIDGRVGAKPLPPAERMPQPRDAESANPVLRQLIDDLNATD